MDLEVEKLLWFQTPVEIEKFRESVDKQVKRVGLDKLKSLARQAAIVRRNAYQPYSGYRVGVALLAESGNVYEGVNVEVVDYLATHAEQSAIAQAVANGEYKANNRKFIEAIAVAHDDRSAPCGSCRQKILEHCDDALVLVVSPIGEIRGITSAASLLPFGFTPKSLGK